MKKILITGGPKAGKSSVLRALEHDLGLPGVFVPEAATMVLRNGFRKRPAIGTSSEAELHQWGRDFQAAVYAAQMLLERNAHELAYHFDTKWCVFDRSEYDGMAYHPDGIAGYGELFGISLADMHRKFEIVIFLETLALSQPELFDTQGNTTRYEESPTEAIAVDNATYQVYSGHPNLHHIATTVSLREKIKICEELIRTAQER